MTQPVLVAVAWPYASAEIHVGNITGSYLPADILARYHRLRGRDVLMVSGSDSHGTPVTVRADEDNSTPEEVYKRYHAGFIELFQKLGLTYDIFTSTHTRTHFDVANKLFLSLKENGYLYTEESKQWYSPAQERFLPDRYVEGTCYFCGKTGARSDQCDHCGHLLEAEKLIDPKSRIDGSTPELRETTHFYLDLEKLEEPVTEFLRERQSYWRPNVIRQSLGQIETSGLRGRPITRDLYWGVPVPVEGWEGKCMYVWFEAVIGYLSSVVEWSQLHDDPEAWHHWWTNQKSRAFYCIGKDNIPFHAIIWPAELIGVGDSFDEKMGATDPQPLVLPYDVPANEFMNLEGKKLSGSHNWAVWGLDFLERYDPDPLRYILTVNMPETRDSDWDWEEFYQRNNNELVATWGNLVNRVLSFAFKHWDGTVPIPHALREGDLELLQTIRAGFKTMERYLEAVKLRAALLEAMRLAGEVNKYLDSTGPWFEIKTDKDAAAKSIYTAMQAIDWLKIIFAPFLPHTCEKLHAYLGHEQPIFGQLVTREIEDDLGTHTVLLYEPGESLSATGEDLWQPIELVPGKAFKQPAPLFKKLDESIVAEERARLGN
ncbi:MAG TPA: methionine--tRNA ligase [Brevefilum fermentans]|jgi:methionyl-tRNA synthetase|uniref:Methionine--tRNA ligase n=1 Tax=Candidatus Brevifilum fermentans TaxID=1986204 RepID=A0A1Y6K798_9CHLR|nr:methionine--tRNA ligase [Brevefilum fermentans]MDI9565401.1 methionine--tRNA ligase [Chloroflexota bacterium]OQB83638.1 MAG: Methionine--tRNA ligase [Chloroflexi bacterium ADurb.Bin120]SMX54727.1 Methionine--tRNA ligase [Brevefilum fermentans]HOM67891.1 methionine--tRNA ligase [Brevefilum fermentans]HPX96481.1 methionine--tRNA ligase [Brevefilum fermentans]